MQKFLYLTLLIVMSVSLQAGSVTMPAIFSENMVIQRDVPIPIWGWAPDGTEVTVSLADQKAKTVAKEGKWKVVLPPMKAGGPVTLAVMTPNVSDTILLTQVLIGEVWIVCGQSNAGMPLNEAEGAEEAVANRFKYPNLRVIEIGRRDTFTVTEPQTSVEGYWGPAKWENSTYLVPRSSTSDVPGCCSALGYFFGREIYDYFKQEIPVGIVQVVAILPVETWIDQATVLATPEIAYLHGKGYPNATSAGFNANVAPLAPFPIRGVVYYQGEMNAGRGEEYKSSLPALIRSWRKAWQNPDLPFLIVQLPGFIKHLGPENKRLDMDAASLAQFKKESAEHGYSMVREAQLKTWQNVPKTGMAVTIDLGERYNIHPRKKLPVAQRLFLQARKLVYGEKDLVAGGPAPEKGEVQGDRFVISFRSVGGGLVAKGGELTGFELSADGKSFVPAQGHIEGSTVVVTNPEIKAPKAVRYAWGGYPDYSLYNKEGLPATPFRY
ncbi:sialate O-acetylesterase [soil metagenome]